jgi:hypothetical protein
MSDDDDCKTMSVPAAGWKYYKLGRAGSYRAAKRGDIPTINVGRLLRVPKRAMERKLDAVDLEKSSSGTEEGSNPESDRHASVGSRGGEEPPATGPPRRAARGQTVL